MKCAKCGKQIRMSGKNYKYIDEDKTIAVHIHCPKTKTSSNWSDEEKADRKLLLDEVNNQLAFNAKGYVATSGINWFGLNNQIKNLLEQGFSFKDQLYALKEVVNLQDGFYGYGAVVNNIHAIMLRKQKKDSELERIQHQQIEQPQVEFDLSKMMDEGEEEW